MTYRHIGPILMSRPDVLKPGVPGRGWRESAIVGVGLLRIGPNSGVISQHEGLLAVIDDCEEIGVGLERVLAGQQRSEERRVGKECRSGRPAAHERRRDTMA